MMTTHAEFEALNQQLAQTLERLGPEREARIRSGFSAATPEHTVLLAVLLLLEGCLAVEHAAAKQPNISNDARNFNTGREAALEDFKASIMQMLSL
jgi:hypothetical protein